jgi:hypothetical protein
VRQESQRNHGSLCPTELNRAHVAPRRRFEPGRDSSTPEEAAELAAATKATEESVEPHALRYVIEALTEGDPDDPVPLSADEAWHLFTVLKTAIDSLHDGCRA